ncbi:MAG: hypothetical protein DHS20C18_31160 [Saprospiraceae bacterium]|nr:MAG: hypothetical protein DHS20C18_31160 [Saprospiraceae bacterium]
MKNLLLLFFAVILQFNTSYAQNVFLNEVNYLSSTTPGAEIAGEAGENLDGWSMVLYDKNGRVTHTKEANATSIPDQQNGYGSIWFDVEQFRSSNGVALVKPNGDVSSFSSYGNSGTLFLFPTIISAIEGPAAGLTSNHIGTQLLPWTSLELIGTGTQLLDFIWSLPLGNTPGQVNTLQYFLGSLFLNNEDNQTGATIYNSNSDVENQTFSIQSEGSYGSISLYPNPARDQLQVQFPNEVKQSAILEVYDFMGRKIKTVHAKAGVNKTQLQLSDLHTGKYLLHIFVDQEPETLLLFTKQ